jgi:hypothetical protein
VAVVSFRWLSASSFCSCFTRSSLSVVPRQLNWCSKCWSRSLLRSMVVASRTALAGLNAPCDGACQNCQRTFQPRSLSFLVFVAVVVLSVTDFKCHSSERHSARVRTVQCAYPRYPIQRRQILESYDRALPLSHFRRGNTGQ